MKRVLILGGTGFIGKPIEERFVKGEWQVRSISRFKYADALHKANQADLFDPFSLEQIIKNWKPNVVISCAWTTTHGKFWNDASNEKYKNATLEFARICYSNGVSLFIGLGSMSEYGENPGICHINKQINEFTSLYSRFKFETGIRLAEISSEYQKNFLWLRIFQAFGQNENPERLIPTLLSSALNRKEVFLGAPWKTLDWISTSEIAEAVFFAAMNELSGIYNIGTGEGNSVKKVAELIFNMKKAPLSLITFNDNSANTSSYACSCCGLISSGWKPRNDLKQNLLAIV